MYWCWYPAPFPIIRFLWWGKNIHLILVLIFVEESTFQLRILSHQSQHSSFHCRKTDFQSLCTDAAILPPSPIIRFLWWAKNYHLNFVLIFVEESTIQLRIISHLGQPSCFHCGKTDFQSLCTEAAILPPSPIIRFLLFAKNIHLVLVLIFVEESTFQLRILSHLGQPSCFHCGKKIFKVDVLMLLFCPPSLP